MSCLSSLIFLPFPLKTYVSQQHCTSHSPQACYVLLKPPSSLIIQECASFPSLLVSGFNLPITSVSLSWLLRSVNYSFLCSHCFLRGFILKSLLHYNIFVYLCVSHPWILSLCRTETLSSVYWTFLFPQSIKYSVSPLCLPLCHCRKWGEMQREFLCY